jgi:hypothetical protein
VGERGVGEGEGRGRGGAWPSSTISDDRLSKATVAAFFFTRNSL